jgi:enhancing lycopene biosynthesis protein 2
MKTVAVILSGCGVYDGSEIQETVLTLLALDRAKARVVCAAPDIDQSQVVNHRNGAVMAGEKRNVLVEASRIVRGEIIPLSEVQLRSVDAVILPGGFGAAKNLSNFATTGTGLTVNPELAQFLKEAHKAGKALGFICISPVIAARLFGSEKVELTIGNDPETAAAITAMGAVHVNCTVHNAVVDRRLKVVTTPAYMLAECMTEAEAGINKLVEAVLELA